MKKIIYFLAFMLLSVSLAHAGQVVLRWKFDFNRDPDVHKFRFYRNDELAANITQYSVNGTEGNFTFLQSTFGCPKCDGQDANYTMTAVDDAGQESAKSEVYRYNPIPHAPKAIKIILNILVGN